MVTKEEEIKFLEADERELENNGHIMEPVIKDAKEIHNCVTFLDDETNKVDYEKDAMKCLKGREGQE